MRKIIPTDKNRLKWIIVFSLVLTFIIGYFQPVEAVVSDSIGSIGVKIAEFLGMGEENSIPNDSEFATASLVEKVNYLNKRIETLEDSVADNSSDLRTLIVGNYSSDKLPTQPTIKEVLGYNKHATVVWSPPTTTNVAVARYNVYVCQSDTAPLSLDDFVRIGTVPYDDVNDNNFTYITPELSGETDCWIMVTSESKKGVENDQILLSGNKIMKSVAKADINRNIFTTTEENGQITSCYTTQSFAYVMNVPEKIDGKTVVGVGSPADSSVVVAAGNFRDLVIPDTVTRVNSYLLNGKTTVSRFGVSSGNTDSFVSKSRLPDSVVEVGAYAFNGATGLDNSMLILPESLETIGDYAYSGTKIKNVKFGESVVRSIGNSAFENCTEIQKVYVPNLESFGELAFKGCTGLMNLECNATTLTTQFQNCPALENIVLDESVATVGAKSFLVTNCGNYSTKYIYVDGYEYTTYYYYGSNLLVDASGYNGTGSSYRMLSVLLLGNNFDFMSEITFNKKFFVNGSTKFEVGVETSDRTELVGDYKEGWVSQVNIPMMDIEIVSAFSPLIRISAVHSGNKARFYDYFCKYYKYDTSSSWGTRHMCVQSGDIMYYNSPNSNGYSRIFVYSNQEELSDSNIIPASQFSDYLKDYSGINLAWIADQFIEQHDISEVEVPSYK